MSQKKPKHLKFHDYEQRWWMLSVIQFVGSYSTPVIGIGMYCFSYGLLYTLFVLSISTVFLILLAAPISFAAYEDGDPTGKWSTVELAGEFMGPIGLYMMAAALLVIPLGWFPIQLGDAVELLLKSSSIDTVLTKVQVTAILGLVMAGAGAFAMKGIKRLSKLSSPLVVAVFFIFFGSQFFVQRITPQKPWGFGELLAGIGLTLGSLQARIADLPTFFRHAKSKNHIMISAIVSVVAFAISGYFGYLLALVLDSSGSPWITSMSYIAAYTLFICGFIANMTNVYAGSVGWEIMLPRAVNKQEYLIIGLFGICFSFAIFYSVLFKKISLIGDIFLGTATIVMVVAYMLFRQREFSQKEQRRHLILWLLGLLSTFPIIAVREKLEELDIVYAMILTLAASLVVFTVYKIREKV